jgi:hypothetical protein
METWIIIAVFLMLCGAASTFAKFDLSSVRNESSTVGFIKSMCASLLELISCFLEKDVGKRNFTKTLIGLILICLGNDYKNYLTIELVYPRAVDPIQNVTELLDLKFNIIQFIPDHIKIQHKSIWLKGTRFYFEIDEGKREHYVLEADRWLLHSSASAFEVMEELASATVKNAWFVSAPYNIQVSLLSAINERNFPLSCHFVKRPFTPEFNYYYFFNPKAEELQGLTAAFLNHGFFEFWKRLHFHQRTLHERMWSLEFHSKRSNSSSTEAFDIANFIGQVHLFVFYTVTAMLTAICIVFFFIECAIQNAVELSLFILAKFKTFSKNLFRAFVRCLVLIKRFICRYTNISNMI